MLSTCNLNILFFFLRLFKVRYVRCKISDTVIPCWTSLHILEILPFLTGLRLMIFTVLF